MAFKFIALAAFLASAQAGFIGGHHSPLAVPLAYASAPVAQAVITKTVDAEYDPHPQYSYAYDVQDSLTGDSKSQHETRDGDVVKGSYSLLEADGTKRVVDYVADPINGFNAVVRKEPTLAVKTVHAVPVVHSAPVVQAQTYVKPVVQAAVVKTVLPAETTISKYSTGFTHHAPVAHTVAEYAPVAHTYAAYSAPVAQTYAAYSAPVQAHYGAPVAAAW
ncbi:larval cuticle protein A2B-like [Leptopilina heterotoma]|uniref:larval cuticle protein A2B-like n=1 Tax=Leptopilina heterotoma TaxID=63436 RepID=UPI001CAA3C4C|nr:larval cuticle protein A2B-like [Leptopilina heterotoma]